MPKIKKEKPHQLDAQADVLNVLGLEPDQVIRRHQNGARVTRPLTWEQMGFVVQPARG